MKFTSTERLIIEDADTNEKLGEMFERAEGNHAVFGDEIMVGVGFDRVAPM